MYLSGFTGDTEARPPASQPRGARPTGCQLKGGRGCAVTAVDKGVIKRYATELSIRCAVLLVNLWLAQVRTFSFINAIASVYFGEGGETPKVKSRQTSPAPIQSLTFGRYDVLCKLVNSPSFQAARCIILACKCAAFKPTALNVRLCEGCEHGWVAHGELNTV